jgi:hypothetical protein
MTTQEKAYSQGLRASGQEPSVPSLWKMKEIIVYVPGQRGDNEPPSLGFSTRTSRLRKVGFQVSSRTWDEMKS